jgi:hypothetical protein
MKCLAVAFCGQPEIPAFSYPRLWLSIGVKEARKASEKKNQSVRYLISRNRRMKEKHQ